MAEFLYLVHRIPWPPDKGDKIRSYNLLQHLLSRGKVHLGCFVDEAEDWQYREELEAACASLCLVPLNPKLARLRSAQGLLTGEALSLPYYRDRSLTSWVRETLRNNDITAQVAFSSSVAPYLDFDRAGPKVIDFVDVDSDKWAQYAPNAGFPMRFIYAREARKLGEAETALARQATASTLVSEAEAALLRQRTGLGPDRILGISNGVDVTRFSPDLDLPSPFPQGQPALVFTGAMDYWPNVDAVLWFAEAVLPAILATRPEAHFYIVGAKPDAKLDRLCANPAVTVTGKVPDTRPYIRHASLSVAPLRIARGIQNKVLEAMACGRAVLASAEAYEGIEAEPGRDLIVAEEAGAMTAAAIELLGDPHRRAALGFAARAVTVERYSWAARFHAFDALLGLE